MVMPGSLVTEHVERLQSAGKSDRRTTCFAKSCTALRFAQNFIAEGWLLVPTLASLVSGARVSRPIPTDFSPPMIALGNQDQGYADDGNALNAQYDYQERCVPIHGLYPPLMPGQRMLRLRSSVDLRFDLWIAERV